MSATARPFSPTPEQQAIAEALKLGGNLAIDAGAGTGKSSTLLYLVREHIPRSQGVLMCVFNKRNQEELQDKLGKAGIQKASAKTFAGMAYSAFWKRYPKSLKAGDFPDTNKYRRLARWWVSAYLPSGRTAEMLKEAAKTLQDLVTMFMVNTTHNHQDGRNALFIGGSLHEDDSLMEHTYAGAHLIAYMYGLYLDYSDDEGKSTDEIDRMALEDMQALVEKGLPDLIHFGRLSFHAPTEAAEKLRDLEGKLLRDGLDLGNGWVDFLDMMYWCVVERWTVWQSPFVLVDEAQDLSPLERALVNMHLVRVGTWAKTPGRLIMVGDPAQAINAFKGADNDGFMNSQIFWGITTVKPLSVCWRCFREIVELAAEWKEGFTAAPDAISGIIADIHDDDLIKMVKDGDAIISRLRSATVVWWRKLVKAGIACKILGQNPADTVIRLLEKVSSFEGFKFETLSDHLNAYEKAQVEKLTKKNKGEAEIMAVGDEIATVRAMIEDIEAKTMDELITKVRDELDPRKMPNGGVSIMTGHGSKGGEWAKVFNVTPDKFPLVTRDQSTGAYIQEKNLQYVVRTRSMQAYFLVSPKHARYDPNAPKQASLPTGVAYDPVLDDDDDTWVDPVDEGFEWTPTPAPTITVETVPVLALPAVVAPVVKPLSRDAFLLDTKGLPLPQMNSQFVHLGMGRSDQGAVDRAIAIARDVAAMGYWDGASSIRIDNPYAVHDRLEKWVTLHRENNDSELVVREAWAPGALETPFVPVFPPLLPIMREIDEAQGITRDPAPVIDVSPTGETPAQTVVPLDAPLPGEAVVIEKLDYKATGNLAADVKAHKAAQLKAQGRVFEVFKRLSSLEDARVLRELLDERIAELEEEEGELEPA